jgi:hypothetical protein
MYKLVVSDVYRNTRLRHVPDKTQRMWLCTTNRNIQPHISLLKIQQMSLNKLHWIILTYGKGTGTEALDRPYGPQGE